MKDSFVFYTKYKKQFELLDSKQQGMLIMAVFEYVETQELPMLTGVLKMAFSIIQSDLDKDRIKWEGTCKQRSQAGAKGGKAKQANATFAKQNKQRVANQADSDSDYECECECDSDISAVADIGQPQPQYIKFYAENIGNITPTVVQEIESFIAENMPENVVIMALKESVDAGAKNWKYAKTVLHSWLERGLTTVEKVKSAKIEFKRRKKKGDKAFPQREHDEQETLERDMKAYENMGEL